jgi:hypothetical protein
MKKFTHIASIFFVIAKFGIIHVSSGTIPLILVNQG